MIKKQVCDCGRLIEPERQALDLPHCEACAKQFPGNILNDVRDKEGHSKGVQERQKLPAIGTRIRFLKALTAPANEDHPYLIYAEKGELGTVVSYGCKEGCWVVAERCVHPFGASEEEFEVLPPNSPCSSVRT